MKFKKIMSVVLTICLVAITSVVSYANSPVISIDVTNFEKSSEIIVPIRISQNPGICGATISIQYDNNLILKDVQKGDALQNLTMTKSGDLSLNPIKIAWDGLESDNSNGVMALLKFETPDKSGEYSISISYNEGDIINDKLNPINISTLPGKIIIPSNKKVTVNISDKTVVLEGDENSTGSVFVAFYNSKNQLISLEIFNSEDHVINVQKNNSASKAKIMWFESIKTIKPICACKQVTFK